MAGVANLKALVGFGLSIGELISDVADGLSFSVIGKLVDCGKQAAPALGGAGAALAEYVAMTDAEAVELENWVVAEFDISDENVEKGIEGALKVAIELHTLVALLLPKPKVA